VFLILPPHAVLISSGDDIRHSTSHRFSSDYEFCIVDGQKGVYMWDKMKTANAINAVRSKEMGLEKNIEGV
jgi:hypothetical protein